MSTDPGGRGERSWRMGNENRRGLTSTGIERRLTVKFGGQGNERVLRWTAAAVLEAVKGFRRLKGHKDMPKLVAALCARDQALGFTSREGVADVA